MFVAGGVVPWFPAPAANESRRLPPSWHLAASDRVYRRFHRRPRVYEPFSSPRPASLAEFPVCPSCQSCSRSPNTRVFSSGRVSFPRPLEKTSGWSAGVSAISFCKRPSPSTWRIARADLSRHYTQSLHASWLLLQDVCELTCPSFLRKHGAVPNRDVVTAVDQAGPVLRLQGVLGHMGPTEIDLVLECIGDLQCAGSRYIPGCLTSRCIGCGANWVDTILQLAASLTNFQALATALEHAKAGFSLHLAGNPLGPEGVTYTCCIAPFLHALNLSNTWLGSRGSACVGSVLRSPECSLEALHLSRNGLDMQCVEYLCAGLKENASIRHLYLNENALDDCAAQEISQLLQHGGPGLRTLDLSSNQIGHSGTAALACALEAGANGLLRLGLRHNNSGNEGLYALSVALMRNRFASKITNRRVLQELYIGHSVADEAAVLTVLNSVLLNDALVALDVAGTNLDHDLSGKVAKIIQEKTNLRLLIADICDSDPTDQPARDQDPNRPRHANIEAALQERNRACSVHLELCVRRHYEDDLLIPCSSLDVYQPQAGDFSGSASPPPQPWPACNTGYGTPGSMSACSPDPTPGSASGPQTETCAGAIANTPESPCPYTGSVSNVVSPKLEALSTHAGQENVCVVRNHALVPEEPRVLDAPLQQMSYLSYYSKLELSQEQLLVVSQLETRMDTERRRFIRHIKALENQVSSGAQGRKALATVHAALFLLPSVSTASEFCRSEYRTVSPLRCDTDGSFPPPPVPEPAALETVLPPPRLSSGAREPTPHQMHQYEWAKQPPIPRPSAQQKLSVPPAALSRAVERPAST
eukprot:gene4992-898_t